MPSTSKSTISIVSIGSGNIAHHFIPALHKIGCEILQVYSRNLEHAQKLAYKVKAKACNELGALNTEADLYLIMVSDDAIPEIITQLPTLGPTQILAHTSGATPTLPLKKKATNIGSFYALQSFRQNKKQDLSEVPFLILGNNAETTRVLRMIARQLSPSVTEVTDQNRLRYHLAAVLMNNFTNHLACLTHSFLDEHQLDPHILKPIVESTFEKILTQNPCENQTGPAKRNDTKIENKHLQLIEDKPYLIAIYKSLSQSIKKLSNENNDQ